MPEREAALKQLPTPDEKTFLDEATWLESLLRHPGWGLVCAYMDGLVQEAADARDASFSSDPSVTHHLHWRWLQRNAMMQAVTDYVARAATERKTLMDELKAPPEPVDSSYPIPESIVDFLEGENT